MYERDLHYRAERAEVIVGRWTFRRTALCCLVLAAACTSWRPREVPDPPAPVQQFRRPVRVTLTDGRSFELRNAIVATDSLFGTTNDLASLRMRFALRDVRSLEENEKDARATLALIAVLALVAGFTGIFGVGFK